MPSEPAHSRVWHPTRRVDVAGVLAVHRRGPYDPAFRLDRDGAVWRTCRPAEAPATVRIGPQTADGTIEATAWGPGAAAALDAAPDWLGGRDDPEAFQPADPIVERLWRQAGGVVIGRTGLVLEALVPAILEQKVTSIEAYRGWAALVRRHGDPAPGPAPDGMRVVPSARAWSTLPSWEWHRAGVGPQRSRTAVRAARLAATLERIATTSTSEADRVLQAVPGIGPWTSAEVRQRVFGDPDAVSVGDSGLPHAVTFALAGERRGTDARMLELLEPYRGQRHRVCTLVVRYAPRPPRRAPRAPLRDFRAM